MLLVFVVKAAQVNFKWSGMLPPGFGWTETRGLRGRELKTCRITPEQSLH